VTGVVLLGAGAAVGLSTANAAVVGSVALEPASGNVTAPIRLVTSGPCAAPAVKVKATAKGFGFGTGINIYDPQPAGFSSTEAMSLPISQAFVVYATSRSTALVGDYTITVQCVNSLGSIVYDEYQTTMTWTTPGGSFANIDEATYTSGAPSTTAPPTTAPPTTAPPTTAPPTTAPPTTASPTTASPTTAPPTTAPPTTTPPVPRPIKVTTPVIVGTARVGKPIYCKNGVWTNAPTSFSYQWFRSGTALSGATSYKRNLSGSDFGKTLTCRVRATNAGGNTDAMSPGVKIAAGQFALLKSPYISGTAKVGNTLKSNRGSWSPTPTVTAYRWYRNGAAIKGATKSAYKLTSADRGRVITLRVVVDAPYYSAAAKTTAGKKVS
jgi:hypothetical protein